MKEARADDLIPERKWTRAMAEEDDHRLAHLLDAIDVATGGVKEHRVGPRKIRHPLDRLDLLDGGDRQEGHGEIRPGLHLLELGADARAFTIGVGLRLDSAPVSPA